jgi:ABC-type Fe3+-siderophore transport system, permease component
MFGEDHRFYLPGSMLIGALVLSLASVFSKNIVPGVIIPVGIVTSLVGVPFSLASLFVTGGTYDRRPSRNRPAHGLSQEKDH